MKLAPSILTAWGVLTVALWSVVGWTLVTGNFRLLMIDPIPSQGVAIIVLLGAGITGQVAIWVTATKAMTLGWRREGAKLREAGREERIVAQSQRQFISHMGHEIRTPLNAVVGAAGLLEEEDPGPKGDLVRAIKNSGRHLLAVVNEMLDFAKIEAGHINLAEAPFSIRRCVEDCLDVARTHPSARTLGIAYHIGDDVPELVKGDEVRLRQVLTNLLRNALDHTDEGHVVIKVIKVKQELAWTIEDSGQGIPEPLHDAIFEAFRQVEGKQGRRQGTGLGLPITRMIVEAMGGRISVSSSPGHGSVFMFQMPLLAAADPRPVVRRHDAPTVLVADTDRAVVAAYAQHLGRAGFNVVSAVSRGSVQAIGRKRPIHAAVITDRLAARPSRAWLERHVKAPSILLQTDPTQTHDGHHAVLGEPARIDDLVDAVQAAVEGAARVVEVDAATSKPLRILVAEDNAYNQMVALAILDRLGHPADVAGNGKEALALHQASPYDVVLMDLQMPVMDGYEATRHLLAEEGPPVIVGLSANGEPEDRQHCLDIGMQAYLSKPISTEELESTLQDIAGGSRFQVSAERV